MKFLCLVVLALAGAAQSQIVDWGVVEFATSGVVQARLDSQGRAVTLSNNAGSAPTRTIQLSDYNVDGTLRLSTLVGDPPDVISRSLDLAPDDTALFGVEEGGLVGYNVLNPARNSLGGFSTGEAGVAGQLLHLGSDQLALSFRDQLDKQRVLIRNFVTNNAVAEFEMDAEPNVTPVLALNTAEGLLVAGAGAEIFTYRVSNSQVLSGGVPNTVRITQIVFEDSNIWVIGVDTALDGGDWSIRRLDKDTMQTLQALRIRGPGSAVDVPRAAALVGGRLQVVGTTGDDGMRAVISPDTGLTLKRIDIDTEWSCITKQGNRAFLGGIANESTTRKWIVQEEGFDGSPLWTKRMAPATGQDALDMKSILADPLGALYIYGTALDSSGRPFGDVQRMLRMRLSALVSAAPSGANVSWTAFLNQAAPRDLTVTLEGTNGSSVPATVTIPSGESSVAFTMAAPSPSTDTEVTIKLDGTTQPWNSRVLIEKLKVASVAVSPSSVFSGGSIFGVVTLSGPAPAGGVNVILQDSSGLATTPASVFVPAGQTTAGFNITTFVSRLDQTITVSAFLNGTTASSTFDLKRSTLQGVEIGPASVIGGTPANAVVKVNGLAAESNIIALTSSNLAAATVPSQVVVVKGQSQASFVVTTKGIAADATVTITGMMNSISQTDTLLVKAAKLVTVSLPATVPGGSTATGTLTTDGIMPPGGAANTVTLSDNSALLTTPASAVFPFLSTSASFTVTAAAVATNTNVTVSAVFRGVTKTATITILRPVIQSIDLSADAVVSGTPVTVTVRLSATAPAGGAAVTIQSSNSALFPVPASVFVPAGSRSISFVRTAGATATTQTVTITAVRFGTASKVLTVVP